MKWYKMKRCYDRICRQCGEKMFIEEEIGRRYNKKTQAFDGDTYFTYTCDKCKLTEEVKVPAKFLNQLMKDVYRTMREERMSGAL